MKRTLTKIDVIMNKERNQVAMNNRFIEAIKSGNLSEITNLIENEEVDPNERLSEDHLLPLELAIESKQIKAFETLITLGATIKIDNSKYFNQYHNYSDGCNWLWYVFIETKAIDLLLPYMIEDGLSDFKMEVLLKKPLKYVEVGRSAFSGNIYTKTEACESILDFIFFNGSKQNKLTIINYILAYYIQKEKTHCTSAMHLMEKTKRYLEDIWHMSIYHRTYGGEKSDKLIKQQIKLMEKCVHVSQTFLARHDESGVNIIPLDVCHKIAFEAFSSSLPGLSNKLIKEIANTFATLVSLEAEKMKTIKIDKITKMAFREWRQNHLSLFYQQRPDKSFIKDYYDCLKESLSAIDFFPLDLRERLLSGLGKLDLDNVNRPSIKETVKHAVNPKI